MDRSLDTHALYLVHTNRPERCRTRWEIDKLKHMVEGMATVTTTGISNAIPRRHGPHSPLVLQWHTSAWLAGSQPIRVSGSGIRENDRTRLWQTLLLEVDEEPLESLRVMISVRIRTCVGVFGGEIRSLRKKVQFPCHILSLRYHDGEGVESLEESGCPSRVGFEELGGYSS